MNTSIKFILHKTNKKEKSGYVYVQKIKNRKKSYRSIGLDKINERYWDIEKQRVRKQPGNNNHEIYNEVIERHLKNILNNDKEIYSIEGIKNRKSFLSFFENIVNSDKYKIKHGTRIKYITVLSKLKNFLREKLKSDLSFSELDVSFLENFYVYMKNTEMETNTIIHYLKILRIILNKSQKETNPIDIKDPFKNYTFEKKESKIKNTLDEEELIKIKTTPIEDKYLNRIRNLFLFQFYSNGMRISDLMTLRYNNLSNGRLKYYMFKTKNSVDIPLSYTLLNLLKDLIGLNINLENISIDEKMGNSELLTEIKQRVITIKPQKNPLTKIPHVLINEVPLFVYTKRFVVRNYYSDEYSQILDSLTYKELVNEYKKLLRFKKKEGEINYTSSRTTILSYDLSKDYENEKDRIDKFLPILEEKINLLQKRYFQKIIDEITKLSIDKKTKDKFVFQLLIDEDFEYTKDLSLIDLKQYQKLHRSRVIYNNNLNRLQKILGFNKHFHSHLPRISFTNIVMDIEGITHRDVSGMLSHLKFSSTEEYLKTGFISKRKDIVQKRVEDHLEGKEKSS